MAVELKLSFETIDELATWLLKRFSPPAAEEDPQYVMVFPDPVEPIAVQPVAAVAEEKPRRKRRTKAEMAAARAGAAVQTEDEEPRYPAPVVEEPVHKVAPPLTVDDCREALKALNDAQGIEAAMTALQRHGVSRISELTDRDYARFIEYCKAGGEHATTA